MVPSYPHNRSQLLVEQFRVEQAEADAPHSQERVVLVRHRNVWNRLVPADIESPDGEATPADRLGDASILGLLFLCSGRFGSVDEEELGAQHPYGVRPAGGDCRHVGFGSDVGSHFDSHPVGRDRRFVCPTAGAVCSCDLLLPPGPILLDGLRKGVDQKHAGRAVDDDLGAIG